MTLATEGLTFAYDLARDVLRDVDIALELGQVTYLLGANGSGKTTLLECLAGLRVPKRGRVQVDGRDLRSMTPRERARLIGLVPQQHEPVFPYSVAEVVLMGRAPHMRPFSRPGAADWLAVDRALEAVELSGLRGRPYVETSGGERQLALIARGLAQGAKYLLMDEPAAHLDPHHRIDVFDAVLRLAESGFSVVIASHQPSNALRFADRVIVLAGQGVLLQGSASEALTEEALRRAYGLPFEILRDPDGNPRAMVPISPRTRSAPSSD